MVITERKEFYTEVYSIVRQIPAGRVATYGMIARLAGKPSYSRLVGQAMADAPQNLSLPCHRVVNASGRLAPHWPEQQVLLEKEGILLRKNGAVDLRKYLWDIL